VRRTKADIQQEFESLRLEAAAQLEAAPRMSRKPPRTGTARHEFATMANDRADILRAIFVSAKTD
jgi:hypothetical protein